MALQGLLIPGIQGGSPEDNKRAVNFTVDVGASTPGVVRIGYSLVSFAVPEPGSGALLALGLLVLSARHRGAQRA